MKQEPFYILCLNGGGVRGVFQSSFLDQLSLELGQPYWKKFHMIAGTSTGAIIGIALSLGISTTEILRFYKDKTPDIFKSVFLGKLTRGSVYSGDILRKNLQEIFKSQLIKSAKNKLLVTASCIDQFKYKIFSNFGPFSEQDMQLTAVDVAMSTSAAPTYFPAATPQGQDRTFVDGGLWANEPSIIALLWANKYLGIDFSRMRLLTVGTGELPRGLTKEEFDSQWPYSPTSIKNIFEIMFAAQSSFADYQTRELIGDNNVLRINPPLREAIMLDDCAKSIEHLLPLAASILEEKYAVIEDLLTRESTEKKSPFSLITHCHNIAHILRDTICKLISRIESYHNESSENYRDIEKDFSLDEEKKVCLLKFYLEEIDSDEVLKKFSDLKTQVLNIEKWQRKLWENLEENVFRLSKDFFSQVTSQVKCHLEENLKLAGIDDKVSISIKLICDSRPIRGTLNRYRVKIKLGARNLLK